MNYKNILKTIDYGFNEGMLKGVFASGYFPISFT